jgi:hypothetical protein
MFATFTACAVVLISLASVGSAEAQATRTWVSGVGNDANPCSRTAPCKTFSGAQTKTADGGEISVLDPGGFGAITITKGLTINGDGTLAGVLAAGVSGVIINAAGKEILLRNISINGVAGGVLPGISGIRFLAGASLTIQNVNVYGFSSNCLEIALTAGGAVTHVVDTNFAGCGTGISVSNTAVNQRASVNVTRSTISDATTGVNGVRQANIALTDVKISGGTTGIVVSTVGAPASEVNVTTSLVTMAGLGMQINSGATGRLNNVYFAANGKALDNQGACQSAGNNSLGGNVNGNTGAACVPLPQF